MSTYLQMYLHPLPNDPPIILAMICDLYLLIIELGNIDNYFTFYHRFRDILLRHHCRRCFVRTILRHPMYDIFPVIYPNIESMVIGHFKKPSPICKKIGITPGGTKLEIWSRFLLIHIDQYYRLISKLINMAEKTGELWTKQAKKVEISFFLVE